MSTNNNARAITPSIPHYVNVFNKTQKTHQRLTPQVSPLLSRLQAEFDIAVAMQEAMHVRIANRKHPATLWN